MNYYTKYYNIGIIILPNKHRLTFIPYIQLFCYCLHMENCGSQIKPNFLEELTTNKKLI